MKDLEKIKELATEIVNCEVVFGQNEDGLVVELSNSKFDDLVFDLRKILEQHDLDLDIVIQKDDAIIDIDITSFDNEHLNLLKKIHNEINFCRFENDTVSFSVIYEYKD